MITNEEAERRGRMYDGEGLTYLFDLDYFDTALEEYAIDRHYTIDAKHLGNESHLYDYEFHTAATNTLNVSVFIPTARV